MALCYFLSIQVTVHGSPAMAWVYMQRLPFDGSHTHLEVLYLCQTLGPGLPRIHRVCLPSSGALTPPSTDTVSGRQGLTTHWGRELPCHRGTLPTRSS